MPRRALLLLLSLQLVSEIFFCGGAMLLPGRMLSGFGVPVTSDTAFLTFVLGLMLLLASGVIFLAIREVHAGTRIGGTLSYLLGLFWVIFGGTLFTVYARVENLYLDTLPGIAICILTGLAYREDRAVIPR